MGIIARLGKLRGTGRVTMIKSVDNHVAGETYTLPTQLADRYICLGYATGKPSRTYTAQEVYSMNSNAQTVVSGRG